MTSKLFLFLTLFALAIVSLSSLVDASGCGTLPSGLSSVTQACMPANSVNWNGQQSYNSLPFNALTGNFYGYNSLSGTVVPLWVENLSLAWSANTFATNSFYFGFTGANIMFGNTIAQLGEAPQLSGSCGLYDNGANVFKNSWNFCSGLPGGWASNATVSAGHMTVAYSSDAYMTANVATLLGAGYANYIVDFYANFPAKISNTIALAGLMSIPIAGGTSDGVGIPSVNGTGIGYGAVTTSPANYVTGISWAQSCGCNIGYQSTPIGTGNVIGSIYIGAGYPYPCGMKYVAGSGAGAGGITAATQHIGVSDIYQSYSSQGSQATITAYWFRTRVYPPSGIMPSVTYGSVQSSKNTLTATPNPYSINNPTIVVGVNSIANTVISNGYAGTTSYTGNWVWIPPASSNIVMGNTIISALPTSTNALTLTVNAFSSQSMSLTFNGVTYWANAIGTNTIYGVWTFNAYASDANGDANPSPQLTGQITVNPILSAVLWTTANSVLDIGQYQTLTANAVGGDGPYTYDYMIYNAMGLCRSQIYSTSLTYNSFTWQTGTGSCGTGSLTANMLLTDFLGYQATNSINYITVAGNFMSTLWNASNTVLDLGMIQTLTAQIAGGQKSYTYNYLIYNTIGLCRSQQYTTASTTNAYSWTTGTGSCGTGSLTANLVVSDSANTVEYVYNSLQYTAYPALVAGAITPPSPIIRLGNTITLNANVVGGASPYTYSWYSLPGASSPACNPSYIIPLATSNLYTSRPTYLQTSYSYQVMDNLGFTQCSSGDIVFAFAPIYLRNATLNPAQTYPNQFSSIPACSGTLGGSCIGNDIISGSQTFSADLIVYGNLTCSSATVYTGGHSIILPMSGSTFNCGGSTFITPSGGAGTSSYGGSGEGGAGGGGGGGYISGGPGANGANGNTGSSTLVAGGAGGGGGAGELGIGAGGGGGNAGSTPSSPSMSNALIQTWFTKGMQTYLAGASGGAGGTGGSGEGGAAGGAGGSGSSGRDGFFVEADTIIMPSVKVNGTRGVTGSNGANGGFGGGGGGGGGGGSGAGTILIVYHTAYTPATYNISGGLSGVGGTGGSGGSGAGGGSGGSGNAGGNGQVVTYQYSSVPITQSFLLGHSIYFSAQTYPIRIYATVMNNTLAYSIYQTVNGITTEPIVSNAILNYTPPSNQLSGYYSYNVLETDSSSSVSVFANVSASMTDITAMTPNTPQIQYFQNIDCLSFAAGNHPTSYSIQSDLAANQHNTNQTGGTCGAVWSNANLTFMPKVTLNYGWMSFAANAVNNPAIASVTQYAFNFIASNTSQSAPYQRELANIPTYSAVTQNTLSAASSYSAIWTMNNYTGTISTHFTANSFQIYVANSLYNNPTITLINQTLVSSASGYYPQQNNYFGNAYSVNSFENLPAYLPPTNSSSFYAVSVYGCSGYQKNSYIDLNLFGNPSTQVQQLFFATSPFQLALLNGYSYQFSIYAQNKQLVKTTPFTQWTSPIQISVPCNQTTPILVTPAITENCTWMNGAAPANQLIATCRGTDTSNLVQSWTINWLNQSNPLVVTTMNTMFTTGASFTATYTFPDNSIQHTYLAQINASVGKIFDPVYVNTYNLNVLAIQPAGAQSWFILGAMLLLPFCLAYFDKIIFIVVLDVMVFIAYLTGIGPFSALDITTLLVGSGIIIAVGVWKSGGFK